MSFRPLDHSLPKPCKTCGVTKSPENFYLVKRGKNREHLSPGREAHCIPCRNKKVSNKKKQLGEEWHKKENARKQRWAEANRTHYRKTLKNNQLKRDFGITLEIYQEMLIEQNNVCAICKNPETRRNQISGEINSLAVDHCHETGKVRGLLCFACNGSIGKFNDSIELLQKAIEYLKKYKT